MQFSDDPQKLAAPFNDAVVCIDSHTAGEMTRLIMTGAQQIAGRTMRDKLAFFSENHDALRLRLCREPRGHRGVLAAALTEPVSADAEFGLIYMDARRYPYLCGHATIGAVASLAACGLLDLSEGEQRIPIDTPSGQMTATARVSGGRLDTVAITMVPSFVLVADREIRVPGFGPLTIDLVCTGGFFAMVDAAQLPQPLTAEHAAELADLGMRIIAAANEQVRVFHPERPEVGTVDVVEFYHADSDIPRRGRGLVVYGEAKVDRSPCGTGTAAKLTLLYHRGELGVGESYVNFSPLQTAFNARILSVARVGDFPAPVVEIEGRAQVTGVHSFVLQPDDPFPEGFLL